MQIPVVEVVNDMSDLTGMFDGGTDLDLRLEQASILLKQAADEQGVDLNSFSEDELAGMLHDIATEEGGNGGEQYAEGGDEKTASDVTYADVSLELTKRAAAEGVDLSQLHPDQYNELFDKVAAEMTDPEMQKWAAQVSQMDELGRVAARSFVDEINKLASYEDDTMERMKRAAATAVMRAGGGSPGRLARAGTWLKDLPGKAEKAYGDHLRRSGRNEIARQGGTSRGYVDKAISAEEREGVGRAIHRARMHGAAGVGATGAAALASHHRSSR